MTQVNLLPAEVKQRQRTRRVTALIVSGAVAALGLLFLVFVLQSARLGKAEDELTAQQQTNAALQTQIGQLQHFADLKTQLTDKQAVVDEAVAGSVSWYGVMRDVSMVIPGEMWLTSLTGAMSAPDATASAATTGATPIIGTIQFAGTALNQPAIAKWLSRLPMVDGWVNPWMSSSTKDESVTPVYQFNVSVDLTSDATVDGGPR
jgi:Tfp pilus assembly protein PilN